MKSVNVSLNSIDKVKSFVNEMCRIEEMCSCILDDMSLMQSQLWEFSVWIYQNQ